MLKRVKYLLSLFGLLFLADKIRYRVQCWFTTDKRKKFRHEHPEVKLPPDYLIYESFRLDYQKYYYGGRETAKWVIGHLEKYLPLEEVKILDWGCGPARVVRHLPDLLKPGCQIYGTDYNPASIQWNQENIPQVAFSLNKLEPPLPYSGHFFDAVYGISIFTHLSGKLHNAWYNELVRITRPGGFILLTMQGRAFAGKLTPAEREVFDQGRIVIRGHTKIGHRTYSAFHPEKFVRELTKEKTVAGFEAGGVSNGQPVQDVWIIRV